MDEQTAWEKAAADRIRHKEYQVLVFLSTHYQLLNLYEVILVVIFFGCLKNARF